MTDANLKRKAKLFFNDDMIRHLRTGLEDPDHFSFSETCTEAAKGLVLKRTSMLPSKQPSLGDLISAVQCILSQKVFDLWQPRISNFTAVQLKALGACEDADFRLHEGVVIVPFKMNLNPLELLIVNGRYQTATVSF